MRFRERLEQMSFSYATDGLSEKNDLGKASLNHIMGEIFATETKPILFDQSQALIFWNNEEQVRDEIQQKLQMPFPKMFLEFSEPITIEEQLLPGQDTEIKAILIRRDPEDSAAHIFTDTPVRVTTFCHRGDKVHEVINFLIDLNNNSIFAAVGLLKSGEDPSVFRDGDTLDLSSMISVRYYNNEVRTYQGMYERFILNTAKLVYWILTYMIAKSIQIVPEPIYRAERRRMEKQGLVNVWNVVQVDPKFARASGGSNTEKSGITHNIQYDVTGHLRFNKHKRKDGTYTHTVEWVPAHRRGLKNSLYVPKQRTVDKDREMDPRMNEYWGENSDS